MFQGRLTSGNFSASPVVVGDKIYVTSEDGDTFIFAADAKLKVIGKNSLGESCFASPAVSRGQIFMRTQRHLWCIGRR